MTESTEYTPSSIIHSALKKIDIRSDGTIAPNGAPLVIVPRIMESENTVCKIPVMALTTEHTTVMEAYIEVESLKSISKKMIKESELCRRLNVEIPAYNLLSKSKFEPIVTAHSILDKSIKDMKEKVSLKKAIVDKCSAGYNYFWLTVSPIVDEEKIYEKFLKYRDLLTDCVFCISSILP